MRSVEFRLPEPVRDFRKTGENPYNGKPEVIAGGE